MAGVSIILANFWLVIVFASSTLGLILFLISMILFNKKNKNSEKVGVKKVVAIAILVISLIFMIPLVITVSGISINNGIQNVKDKEKLDSIQNKIIVDRNEWKKGFKYDDKELVPINIFMNSENYHLDGKLKNLDEIGAIVMNNSNDYYYLYELKNNSGYKLYYVWVESFTGGDYYSRTFVDKSEYNKVLTYYDFSKSSINVLWKSAPKETGLRNNWKNLNQNLKSYSDLIRLSHEVLDDVSDKKQVGILEGDEYNCFSFKIKSNDNVFTIQLDICQKNDEMVVYLNNYKVENRIVEKYKDTLETLINNTQTELLKETNK